LQSVEAMSSKAQGSSAGKAKSKGPSPLATSYVVLYNVVQVFGWSFILFRLGQFYADGNSPDRLVTKPLYDYLRLPLLIFQTAALLEVVHAMVGLVRSPVMTTLMQVASRIVLTWGIANAVPVAQNHYFLTSMVAAWGVTEVIRYSFYALNTLNGKAPYFLTWLRYTLFYVLYPLGVASELGLIIVSLSWIKQADIYSIHMPNSWNFAFSYYYFLYVMIASYIPFFPQLFMHMVRQRSRSLSDAAAPKDTKKA